MCGLCGVPEPIRVPIALNNQSEIVRVIESILFYE